MELNLELEHIIVQYNIAINLAFENATQWLASEIKKRGNIIGESVKDKGIDDLLGECSHTFLSDTVMILGIALNPNGALNLQCRDTYSESLIEIGVTPNNISDALYFCKFNL